MMVKRVFVRCFLKILMLLVVSQMMGCKNSFLEFADTESDKALVYEARRLIDGQDWTGAITKLGQLSVAGQAKRENLLLFASAHAGRCGLNLISMANEISNSESVNLFPMLLSAMRSSSAAGVTDCVTAEQYLQQVSADPAARTGDENLLMVFINFAKIGAIFADSGDSDGNGQIDASYDPCADLTDDYANEVTVGIASAIGSIGAAGSSIDTGGLEDVSSVCTDLETTFGASYNFCSVTSATDVTADMRQAIRSLANANQGIGFSVCDDTVGNCLCVP